MSAATQSSPLNIRFAPGSALVGLHAVRALTGWRRDEIFDRVDGGSLLHPALVWVFNLAADVNGERRDLRFWAREVEGHIGCPQKRYSFIELDAVIRRILPERRQRFHSGEVIALFALSRPELVALRGALGGEMAGPRSCFFERAALASFLTHRWLGASRSAKMEASR
ncbi:MAG: hypothetical protein KGL39_46365 [Patescibacteria group bacterium]|nr:hypothetical protein [Patescibacteria group bacterium]